MHRIMLLRLAPLALVACAAGPDDAVAPSAQHLEIRTAALDLPGIDFACYDVRIENGATVPETVVGLGDPLVDLPVDTQTLCSTQYGDGAGGAISYVAPCDAADPAHTVTLWVDGLYTGTPASPVAVAYQDPCPDGCQLPVTCEANADTAVTFNLTIARPANQGFFDVAIQFEQVFCSAKVDCVTDTGDLTLLHNPATGERDQTAVVALACTGGPGDGGDPTILLRDPLVITCDGGETILDPTVGPGNAYTSATPDPDPTDAVWQYATYVGDESLSCGGVACNKRFWNVAIGFDPDAANCTLSTRATAASEAALTGYETPANTAYPYIDVNVTLTGPTGGLACSQHPLNEAGSGVETRYTALDAPASFCQRYDTASGFTTSLAHCPDGFAPRALPNAPLAPLLITPSSNTQGDDVAALVDGDLATGFTVGAHPPSDILFDLGDIYAVERVTLVVDQSPYGNTHHEVWAGLTPGDLTLVGGFARYTASLDALVVNLTGREARYVSVVTHSGPSWVAWREITIEGRPTQGPAGGYCANLNLARNPNLQYFGYFASNVVYGDYSSELAGISNVVFVSDTGWNECAGAPDPQLDIDRIVNARANGLKSIVQVPGLFFTVPYNTWNPNAASCWSQYSAALQPYADDIVAFNLLDEPYGNRLQWADPASPGVASPRLTVPLADTAPADHALRAAEIAQLEADMAQAAGLIAADFPGIPVMMVFTGLEVVEPDIHVPAGYDLVGFDCYGDFELCGHSGLSIIDTHEALKVKLTPDQQMFLMPDANRGFSPSLEAEINLLNIFENYMDLALYDPRVVAVFPFTWQTIFSPGVRDLSAFVRDRYEAVGACFP